MTTRIDVDALKTYCYLHTHVKDDGSVLLDITKGIPGRFARVNKECQALRANPQEMFRRLVNEASTHVSLNLHCILTDDCSYKTTTQLKWNPVCSWQTSILLTDAYRTQLQRMDHPSSELRRAQKVDVVDNGVVLTGSDFSQSLRFVDRKKLQALEASFDHPEEPSKIEWQIAEIVKEVLQFKADYQVTKRLNLQIHAVTSRVDLNHFFVGKLCKTDNAPSKIYRIVRAGYGSELQRHFSIEWAPFCIQCVEEPSPEKEQIKAAFKIETFDRIIRGAFTTASRNCTGATNLTNEALQAGTYTRTPASLAEKAELVRLLEPEVMIWARSRAFATEVLKNRGCPSSYLDDATMANLQAYYSKYGRKTSIASAPQFESSDKKDGT
ncbi:MAG: hypothetical protein ACHQT8_03700 [Chlamydiales bacterium]